MYKVLNKFYRQATDVTRIRILRDEDGEYRDIETELTGDETKEADDVLIKKVFAKLSREFDPSLNFEQLIRKIEEQEKLTKTVTSIFATDLTTDQKENILNQYEKYEVGKAYRAGDVFSYNDNLYQVIQAHTSQSDWKPDGVPALYKVYLNVSVKTPDGEEIEVIADFVQPTGAHDAYKTGDKVRFEGKIYKSKVDNNAYSPAAYAANWELIEE